jgi:arginyl-tRNA synthetase
LSLYAAIPRSLTAFSTNWWPRGRLNADVNRKAVAVEPPRDPSHGDLATNAAMVLAKAAGTNPRARAEAIKPKLEA